MEGQYKQTSKQTRVMRMQLPICDRTVTSEVSSDISLPDYQPEIKRLLRVSATVQPPSRYIGGGAMELSGTVDYCILYTGNDGQMYCFPTSADYAFRVPLEAGADFDLSDALVAYAYSEPESIISRVGGPRRMSVKCRLRSRIKAYGNCVIEEKRSGATGEVGEQRLLRESDTSVASYGVSAPFRVSDEVALEQEEGGDWRIVSGDVQVLVSEAVCSVGRISCRGEAVLKLLLQKEGEGTLPVVTYRKLPVDHTFDMDGVNAMSRACVVGSCTELSLSMEDGRVLCEAELVLEARAERPEAVSYTCDAYVPGHESRSTTKTYRPERGMCRVNVNFTQSEMRPLDEVNLPPAARVIDVYGTAQLESVESERDRHVLSGKCRYTLITVNEGEIGAKEIELPFRYTLDGTAVPNVAFTWEGQAQLVSARARMDGERLGVDAELGIWLCAVSEQSVDVVDSIEVGAPITRPTGQMLLCYPEAHDTLWSVAKRYGVSLEQLEQGNGNRIESERRADDAASLSGVRCLVIS